MLIGHLPTGYLAATAALDRLNLTPGRRRTLLTTALVASVAPDADVIAFYATGGQVHHHAYPTHWPLFWAVVVAVGLAVAAVRRSRWLALATATVGAAVLLHLSLDSIAGAVRWGAPFTTTETTLVDVPARYDGWVWSMVLHWTFAVELALTAVAGGVWGWRRTRRASAP